LLARDRTAAALDAEFGFGDEAKGFGVGFAFGNLDAGVEGFRGVGVEDGHGGLGDDGAAVDALIDEVNGAAGDFDAVFEGLAPGFEARKGGEERWMDVDDAIGEGAEEFAFQDAHEAGEGDVINLRFFEGGDVAGFGFVVEFGAEFSRGDKLGVEFAFARALENAGGFDVAENGDDFVGAIGSATAISDGDHVRAFARAENADSFFGSGRHGLTLSRENGRG
jgi:hypothetical protein